MESGIKMTKMTKKAKRKTAAKPKLGRPPLPESEKIGRGKCRQIGRVHDDEWEQIQIGFRKSGLTSFTRYTVELLLKSTKKMNKVK